MAQNFSFDFTQPSQEFAEGEQEIEMKNPVEEAQEAFEAMDEPLRRKAKFLYYLQGEYNKLETEFSEEMKKLEQKYEEKYKPIYERRDEVVGGWKSVSDDEFKKAEEYEQKVKKDYEEEKKKYDEKLKELQEKEKKDEEKKDEEKKDEEKKDEEKKDEEKKDEEKVERKKEDEGIKEFWKSVLVHSELKGSMIQNHDEPSLEFLTNLSYENFDDKENEGSGFRLIFEFSENPFFSNDKLVKTYYNDPLGEDIIDCAGTEIQWKSKEKNLTIKMKKKTQRNKSGRARTKEIEEMRDSFFNFFNALQEPDEENELEPEDVEDLLQADIEIGHTFKEDIIPHATEYFLGITTHTSEDVLEALGY